MKHPPGSMGSCFIWQRTAEPPSFCPAVPSFLEFKQNSDCYLIGKQVLGHYGETAAVLQPEAFRAQPLLDHWD